jgi:rare lipoprotein A
LAAAAEQAGTFQRCWFVDAVRVRVYDGLVRQKIGMALAAILLVCGWHTCVYDRATWYGERERGKPMANGRRFNPDALTAASWNYPLGSRVRVAYRKKSVVVEVTDRGGARAFLQFGKVVDLSHAAFERLEKPSVGSIRVRITREE